MPRVIEDSAGYELWKNGTRSTVILKRMNRAGGTIDEVIRGGKNFHITPEERRFNQEIAATDSLDMFQNGLLSPVKLIEGTEDVAQFASNPNHISEDEMVDLLNGKPLKAYQDRIAQMTNAVTINRMLELAESEDTNATVKHVQALEARRKELQPELYQEIETVDTRGADTLSRATSLR